LNKNLLEINQLTISPKNNPQLHLVDNISFQLKKGKTTCIVGESGSGKSLTALSIIKLLSIQLKASGKFYFNGEDISNHSEKEMRLKRGQDIAMIFQEPMTSLNPVLTIGYQIQEAVQVHHNLEKNQLQKRTHELLDLVGIPSNRASSFPDELSGGQRQRIMIAMAMSCNPTLLIADEPTTALDVTVQAQILDLLDNLKNRLNMTMLFITHDFGVVNDIADDVIVMFKGNIVEQGSVKDVLSNPSHPYTKALLSCVPDSDGKKTLKPIDYEKLYKKMA
tara:strand:+ start:4348 stop:5181 length:834 start_codon:yes stop_codon:yes gene_type:complete